ncbi:hypothetical protein SEA_JACKO_22 [Microbacterium phage Jacko]|nr:hypothetical protein SEA_JACKO_22 [Microbacterium phage Jacko]
MGTQISNKDIRPGDTITVSRKLKVSSVRDYGGSSAKNAVVVSGVGENGTSGVTILVAEYENVELIDRKIEIPNPETALFVWWQDEVGNDYYARKADKGNWVTDSGASYTSTHDLIEDITEGGYHDYKQGSLQVIKRNPSLASGGYVHGTVSLGDHGRSVLRRLNVVS